MDLSVSTSLAAIAIALGGFLIHHKYKQHRDNPDGLPYPPGPKRLPIVGCALEMPATLPWFGFAELAKKYGATHVNSTATLYFLTGRSHRRRYHVFRRVRSTYHHYQFVKGRRRFVREEGIEVF